MLKKTKFLGLVLGLSLLALRCNDEKKAEEPVAPAASTAPAPTPPPSADIKAEAVYFAYDDYTLNSDSQGKLNQLADSLKANAGAVVQIEGHCDERGSIEYNLALGQRRAESVKKYLIQMGVDGARLSTISYGEERPAAQGHNEAAWSKNRRAEFVVTKS